MAMLTKDLMKVLEAGGSLSIRASLPTQSLVQLAKTAKSANGRLYLRGVSKPTADLVKIAKSGGTHVVMEIE